MRSANATDEANSVGGRLGWRFQRCRGGAHGSQCRLGFELATSGWQPWPQCSAATCRSSSAPGQPFAVAGESGSKRLRAAAGCIWPWSVHPLGSRLRPYIKAVAPRTLRVA